MTGATHLTFGILASVANWKITGNLHMDAVIIGTFLPDIDSADSIISKSCEIISKPINWIQKHSEIIDHRRLMHALWIPLGLVVWWYFTRSELLYNLWLGYFVHLFADALTDRGIKPFYPIFAFKIHLAKITTGSRAEEILNSALWLVIFGMFLPRESLIWIYEKGRTLVSFVHQEILKMMQK